MGRAPVRTWSGVRTEGLRLNSRSFRGVRTSSGWGLASPARGPSSTGISMSARRAADWACGVGSGRWVLRERGGSGSSSSSYSGWGRLRM